MVASLTTAPIHNLVQIFFPFKREKTIGLYESACLAVLNKLRATASSISAFWDLYTISLIQMTLRLSCSDNRTSSGGDAGHYIVIPGRRFFTFSCPLYWSLPWSQTLINNFRQQPVRTISFDFDGQLCQRPLYVFSWKLSAVPEKGDERRSFQVHAETSNSKLCTLVFHQKREK